MRMISREEAEKIRLENIFIEENEVVHVEFLNKVITESAEKGFTSASFLGPSKDSKGVIDFLLSYGFSLEYRIDNIKESDITIVVRWD